MTDHRARVPVAFPDAPKGTCQHCGRPCPPTRKTHEKCKAEHRAANDYRAAARDVEGEVQTCIDCGVDGGDYQYVDGKWKIAKIERDHPFELQDNGPRDFTVARCQVCHRAKTERVRQERMGKSKGRGNAAAIPLGTRLKWAAPFLAGGVVWWWVARHGVSVEAPSTGEEFTRWLWILVGVVAAAVGLVYYGRWVGGRRDAAVERLVVALAKPTHTAPDKIVVRVKRMEKGAPVAGRVEYSPLCDDDNPKVQATIEGILTRKIGRRLAFTWEPEKDRLSWRLAQSGVDPAPEVPVEVDYRSDVSAVERERVKRIVEESVAAAVKVGDTSVDWGVWDEDGPCDFKVQYPSAYPDDTPETRYALASKVHAKAPGRWRGEWDTHRNLVVFVRRPPMPASIPHPVTEPPYDTWLLPFGADEDGAAAVWNLRTHPHALVSGVTGGGKSNLMAGFVIACLMRGFLVIIIDGKGTALAGFRDWPGVIRVGLGDPADMADAMEYAENLMRKRYTKVRDTGADPDDFQPVMVFLDEAAEFATNVARWHETLEREYDGDGKVIPKPKIAPSLDSWRAIARLARECHMHLIVGIQQAAASFFGGTESRDQLPARFACGPTSKQGADMMFGRVDIGRDVPTEPKGRVTAKVDNREPFEVQSYYTPRPLADGRVKPEDEAILGPLRAAVEAVQHQPRSEPEPAPEWEWVDLDDLADGDRVLVDVNGEDMWATLTGPPYADEDDDDHVEIAVVYDTGEPDVILADNSSEKFRRAPRP